MDKIIILPDRHNPFQIWLLMACVVTGTVRLFRMPHHEGAVTDIPHGILVTWYLFLLVGGLVGLLSLVTRDEVTGYLIERSAMLLLASATGFYIVAHVVTMGVSGSFSLIFVGAFGFACLWQAWRIGRVFKAVRPK